MGGGYGRAGQGGASGVGASGGGAFGGALGSDEKSYKEIMEEKTRVWKEEWRKRGYSDSEIPQEPGSQALPEPKIQKAAQPKVRKKYAPSKNTTDELHRYQLEEEKKKSMKLMADEGEALMNCIKVGLCNSRCGLSGDVLSSAPLPLSCVCSTATPWKKWSWHIGCARERDNQRLSSSLSEERSRNRSSGSSNTTGQHAYGRGWSSLLCVHDILQSAVYMGSVGYTQCLKYC